MFTVYAYNPNINLQGTTGTIRFFGSYEGKVTNVFSLAIVDVQFYIDEEPPIIPGFDSVRTTKARCKVAPVPKAFNVNYVIEGKYLINIPEDALNAPGEWTDIPYSEVSFAEYFIHGSRPGYTHFEFFLCVGDSEYSPTFVQFLDKRGAVQDKKFFVNYNVSCDGNPNFYKFMAFNHVGLADIDDSYFASNVYRCDKDLGKAMTLRNHAEAYYRQGVFIVLRVTDDSGTVYHIFR